jgi:alkylation response protein AidB-like acyl-CoA dehydrogenase
MDLQRAIRSAEEIARELLVPLSEETDRTATWPERQLRALQSAIGGLVVPREHGGMGLGMVGLAHVCEVLARECPSTAICFGMHCVGAAVLSAKASPEQVERYLTPIVAGKHLTTLALSEPGTGAHFYIPQTRLLRDAKGPLVIGTKSFVTSGGQADSYVINVAAGEASHEPGRFSCVVVPKDAPGLRWEGTWDGWGMRGNSSIAMHLEEARLSTADLLGTEGDELWYVFNIVAPYFLVAMSATYAGAAQGAIDDVRVHLTERSFAHSGRRLSEIGVLQHRLGSMWGRLEATRRLIHHAAGAADAAAPDALLAVCSAKAEVAEAATWVANEAMTLLGGRGYQARGRTERRLRDIRAAHVMAPTTDVLRLWVGRALLGMPLLGD